MTNTFGKRIRGQREALRTLDLRFRLRQEATPRHVGLRQIAAKIGVEPSYLSKVERGLVPPPSKATILRLAEALSLDRDELLGLAGKIPEDVRRAILKRPKLLAGLVRQFAKVSDAGVRRVILRARRSGKQ